MIEEFETLIRNAAEEMGYQLVEFTVNEKTKKVTIVIYKKSGITIKDCEDMTNRILSEIDFYDKFRADYDIIVSSPGVEREFKNLNEYKIFEGKEVKIVTDYKENPIIIGILKGIDSDNNIVIEENLKIRKIPYIHIKRGQLIFDF